MNRSRSRAPKCRTQGRERGAAAVEFALVAPVLLALVGGIIEFSYTYNLQISVTQAAREAARDMAIHNKQDLARAAAVAGAPGTKPGWAHIYLHGRMSGRRYLQCPGRRWLHSQLPDRYFWRFRHGSGDGSYAMPRLKVRPPGGHEMNAVQPASWLP